MKQKKNSEPTAVLRVLYCLRMNQGSSDMCGSVYTHSNGTSHRPRYVEATKLLLGIECSTSHLWDSVSGSYALQLGCRKKRLGLPAKHIPRIVSIETELWHVARFL